MTFEEFVSARLGALVRYATVVTWDPHLAEDITQNVLVRASARWSRIGRLSAPEMYVNAWCSTSSCRGAGGGRPGWYRWTGPRWT